MTTVTTTTPENSAKNSLIALIGRAFATERNKPWRREVGVHQFPEMKIDEIAGQPNFFLVNGVDVPEVIVRDNVALNSKQCMVYINQCGNDDVRIGIINSRDWAEIIHRRDSGEYNKENTIEAAIQNASIFVRTNTNDLNELSNGASTSPAIVPNIGVDTRYNCDRSFEDGPVKFAYEWEGNETFVPSLPRAAAWMIPQRNDRFATTRDGAAPEEATARLERASDEVAMFGHAIDAGLAEADSLNERRDTARMRTATAPKKQTEIEFDGA